MESSPDHSSPSDAKAPRDGKLHRIASHTQGLVSDLREWVDLRIDLALLEVEEQVDELRNEMALGLITALLGLFAGLFVLATVALGVGWLLGHSFWGFLIVSGLLVGMLAILRLARPALVPPSHLFQSLRGNTQPDEAGSESAPGNGPGRKTAEGRMEEDSSAEPG